MNEFSKFMKLTEESAQLIKEATQIYLSDLNTDDYITECGYYDYDNDNPFKTVLNFIEDFHLGIK